MRKYLTNEKILTYTCYTGAEGHDGNILKKTRNKIDWINLMAYFDNYKDMVDLFNDYSKVMPSHQITIGVKAGDKSYDPSTTEIDEVAKLCCWDPVKTEKYGIMLWTINRDIKQFTGKDDGLWTKTISEYLKLVNEALNLRIPSPRILTECNSHTKKLKEKIFKNISRKITKE